MKRYFANTILNNEILINHENRILKLEKTFGRPNEMYSLLGIELLQREIEHYKKTINCVQQLRVNQDNF